MVVFIANLEQDDFCLADFLKCVGSYARASQVGLKTDDRFENSFSDPKLNIRGIFSVGDPRFGEMGWGMSS